MVWFLVLTQPGLAWLILDMTLIYVIQLFKKKKKKTELTYTSFDLDKFYTQQADHALFNYRTASLEWELLMHTHIGCGKWPHPLHFGAKNE